MIYKGEIYDFVDLDRIQNTLSSKYWSWIIREESHWLLDVVSKDITNFNPSLWEKNPDFGGIYINGKFQTKNVQITPPVKIEFYQPKFSMQELEKRTKSFNSKKHIIFEDEYILAVFKPEKLHSMPAKEQKIFNLHKSLTEYTNTKIHMPSRLDFSTSGLILVSKNKLADGKLQQTYENRLITKEYLLKVSTEPEWTEITNKYKIARDLRHPVLRKSTTKDGLEAETYFKKIKNCIISATPKTGRTHQIRTHSASMGFPIIGDNFYGGEVNDSLHLFSKSLKFVHPVSGEEMFLDVPDNLRPKWSECGGTQLNKS